MIIQTNHVDAASARPRLRRSAAARTRRQTATSLGPALLAQLLCVLLAFASVGCDTEPPPGDAAGGAGDEQDNPPTPGEGPGDSDGTYDTWLVELPAGDTCALGGVRLIVGVDANQNGVFDAGDQLISEETLCHAEVDTGLDRTEQMTAAASAALDAEFSIDILVASLKVQFSATPGEIVELLAQLADDWPALVEGLRVAFDIDYATIAKLLHEMATAPFSKARIAYLYGVELGIPVEEIAAALLGLKADVQAKLDDVVSMLSGCLSDGACAELLRLGDAHGFATHIVTAFGKSTDFALWTLEFLYDLSLRDAVAIIVDLGYETADWAAGILKEAGAKAADVAEFLCHVLGHTADVALDILHTLYNMSISDAVHILVEIKAATVEWAVQVLQNAGMKAFEVAEFVHYVLGKKAEKVLDVLLGLYDLSISDAVSIIVELKIATVDWAAQALKKAGMKAADVAWCLVHVLKQSADKALDVLRGLYHLSLHDAVAMIVDLKLATVHWAANVLKNAGMGAIEVARFIVNVLGHSVDVALDILRGIYNMSLRDAVRMLFDLGLGSLDWALKVLGGVFFP